jgi:hypothetical protein
MVTCGKKKITGLFREICNGNLSRTNLERFVMGNLEIVEIFSFVLPEDF